MVKKQTSDLICSNYIEFSYNRLATLLQFVFCSFNPHNMVYIKLVKKTTINVTNNKFDTFTSSTSLSHAYGIFDYKHPLCFFQYSSKLSSKSKLNYSIIFDHNHENNSKLAYSNLPLTHCSWLPQSAFNNTCTMPLEMKKNS